MFWCCISRQSLVTVVTSSLLVYNSQCLLFVQTCLAINYPSALQLLAKCPPHPCVVSCLPHRPVSFLLAFVTQIFHSIYQHYFPHFAGKIRFPSSGGLMSPMKSPMKSRPFLFSPAKTPSKIRPLPAALQPVNGLEEIEQCRLTGWLTFSFRYVSVLYSVIFSNCIFFRHPSDVPFGCAQEAAG